MNREVEERIVAMYFDNKDFEKNAKTTIETLGQLKEGLNIEDSAEKGFKVFEKIGKTLNFEKANANLTTMRTKLNSMEGALGKVFKITSEPLRQAEGLISTIRGYLGKVVGFDLASKIVNSTESALRSLTVQPISAGWNQYQSKMDSVKTIMSSTGEDIETVEKYLQSMTEYANKTIYSLTDMTSNLGKFTNNGIELSRATKAMEGIANATADAGQGAQQASMAMYNISQAMGVGKMTTIDWKSLENANIATTKLKNTFLEMAAASGKLRKEVKEIGGKKVTSFFLDTDENGQKLKTSIELTAANFREYLSKGWLDKETMLRTFEIYSGQGIDVDILESWGIKDKELQKQLMELGQQSLEAATEVRTFTKMMDALKESVQSGWAESFEILFGNMEQGTELWTRLSEVLDEILSKSAEARNSILKDWAGDPENSHSSEKQQIEELKADLEAKKQYLAELKKSEDAADLETRMQKIDADREKLKQRLAELKAEQKTKGVDNSNIISRKEKSLKELDAAYKELEERKKKLEKQQADKAKNQAQVDQYNAEIKAVQDELEIVKKQSVKDREGYDDPKKIKERDKKIAELQKKQRELEKKRAKLVPGIDEVNKTEQEILAQQKQIEQLEKELAEEERKPRSKYLDEQGRTGRDIAVDTLFEIVDLVKTLGKAVSDAWHNVFGTIDGEKLFKFTQKVEKAVKGIVDWFGKAEDSSSRLNKIQKGLQGVFSIVKAGFKIVSGLFNLLKRLFAPVLDVIVDAFGKIFGFFDGLGDMKPVDMFKKVGEGLKTAWEKIKGFFKADETGESPFIKWVNNAWQGFKDVVHKWMDDMGLGEIWDSISTWWENTKKSFEDGWKVVSDWFEETGIAGFFRSIWDEITRVFTPEVVDGVEQNAPIVQFFLDIKTGVEDAFKAVRDWWNRSGIPEFFSGMWDAIVGLFQPQWKEGYRNGKLESWYEDSPIVAFFNGIIDSVTSAYNNVSNWWNNESGIPQFFSSMWDSITGLFKPQWKEGIRNGKKESWYEDSPIVEFFKGLGDKIASAYNSLSNWWNNESGIPQFFSNMWDAITGAFKPTVVDGKEEDSPIVKFFVGLGDGISKAFEDLKNWWNNDSGIPAFFEGMWDAIVSWFTPKGVASGYRNGKLESWYEDSPVVSFFKDLWEGIKKVYEDISKWWNSEEVQGVIKAVGDFFTGLWTNLMNLFNGGTGESENGEGSLSTFSSSIKEGAKVSENTVKDVEKPLSFFERIIAAVGQFFDKVKGVLTKVKDETKLGKFLDAFGTFFSGLVDMVSNILSSLGHVMSGNVSWQDGLTLAIPGIIIVLGKVFTLLNNKYLSKVGDTQNFAQKFLEIAAGLFLLATGISILTTVDQSKMVVAAVVIGVLGGVIAAIVSAVSKLNGSVAHNAALTGGQQILNNLINTIGKVGMLAVALALLPNIIKTIGEVKKEAGGANIGDDLLKVLLGITAAVAGISVTLAVVNKLTGNAGIDPAATFKTVISVLEAMGLILVAFMGAGGLLGLLKKYVSDEAIDVVVSGINELGKVFSAIGGAIGGFFASLFGGGTAEQKATASAEATRTTVNALAEMSEAFDMEKISGITRMITMIQTLSNGSEMIDSSKLENFAVAMQRIGAGLYEIAGYILNMEGPLKKINDPNADETQKLQAFIDYTGKLIQALAPMNDIHIKDVLGRFDEIAKKENLEKFVENINTIMTGLGGLNKPDSGIQFDGLTIVQKLFDAIQKGLVDPSLPKFDALPVVDAIIEALQLGDSAIAQIVHDMVQNGLNLNKNPNGGNTGYTNPNTDGMEWFTGLLNGEGLDTSDLTKNFHTQLYGEDGNGGLLGEINGFGDKIPSMASMFENKGWLDFKDEDGKEIDILGEVQSHLTELGQTLDTMEPLKITITPVFDYKNLNADSIREALLNRPIPFAVGADTGKMTIDFTGLESVLDLESIRSRLDSVVSAVNNQGMTMSIAVSGLASHMDGVARSVASLQMILDTGTLVGELAPRIDAQIYKNNMILNR